MDIKEAWKAVVNWLLDEPIETEKKAVWSAAAINDLPDAAFAVVESGGEKDEDGKTIPRSLRHLPHHNGSVTNPNDDKSVDLPHLRNALARAPQSTIAANLKQRAISHLQGHARRMGIGEAGEKQLLSSFKVVEADGKKFWVSITTNAFEDREGEVFTTQALENYVAQAEKGLPPELETALKEMHLPATQNGELWLMHLPGSRIGEPRWHGVEGRFLLEAGVFDDTPIGQKAAAYLAEHGEDYKNSHGFMYHTEDKEDKVFDWFWKFETSVVPAGWASNPWTGLKVIAEEAKSMDERKKAELVKMVGEELANDLIAKAQEGTKALEEAGVAFKADDAPAPLSTPALATPPAPAAQPFELNRDSEQFKALVAAVAEAIGQVGVKEIKESIDTLGNRMKDLEDADKPLMTLGRGFRASRAEANVIGKEAAEKLLPGVHPLDGKFVKQKTA